MIRNTHKSFLLAILMLFSVNSHATFKISRTGKYLGMTGFTLGVASAIALANANYKIACGLGSLSAGSFLLSPIASDVFGQSENINTWNIKRYKKTLSCAGLGFICTALGVRLLGSSI